MPRWCFAGFFALVWIINGLVCKILDLAPRHRAIVARILGDEHSLELTRLIGLGELLLAAWILSQWKWRVSASLQIAAVFAMNVIEFFLAPDLLLFGRWNAFVASAYILLVAYAGFRHAPPRPSPA